VLKVRLNKRVKTFLKMRHAALKEGIDCQNTSTPKVTYLAVKVILSRVLVLAVKLVFASRYPSVGFTTKTSRLTAG